MRDRFDTLLRPGRSRTTFSWLMKRRNVKLLGIRAGAGAGRPGAQDGPATLREMGLIPTLEAQGHTLDDLGDVPGAYETFAASRAAPLVKNLPNILQVNRHTHAAVLGTRRHAPDDFLLIIGGDHSLAIGTLAGLSDACKRLGLIWIDAHADFNKPGTSPSGNLHGMSLAVACGYGVPELRRIAGRDPMIAEADVHLLAVRDLDRGERELLESTQVRCVPASELLAGDPTQTVCAAARQLRSVCDHVHLSFDIDALDASLVPGTGTPVPGGLSVEQAERMLQALSRDDAVDSAEFVEYNPSLDEGARTGQTMLRLIEALMAV
ncbi:MAG: arginase [Planctomycetota bacterium]|nr:MAG: arginase [Planctomycetota bacterium]